jgi:hypothetical protein
MRMLRIGDIGDGTTVDENPLRDSARGTNSTTREHVPRRPGPVQACGHQLTGDAVFAVPATPLRLGLAGVAN